MPIRFYSRLFALALVVAVLFGGQPAAQAQSADGVLARLKHAYEQTDALRADFTYSQRATGQAVPQQRSGTITLQADRYRIAFPKETFVSDGTTTWYHSAVDDQVIINDYIPDETAFSPSSFFLTYPDQFNVRLGNTAQVGGAMHYVLHLSPKQGGSLFEAVTLWVRTSDAAVTRLEVEDQNGTTHRFDLSNIERNPTLGTGTFMFTVPASADVTDLRM